MALRQAIRNRELDVVVASEEVTHLTTREGGV